MMAARFFPVTLRSGQDARPLSLRLGLAFGPRCGPAPGLASVQASSLAASSRFFINGL